MMATATQLGHIIGEGSMTSTCGECEILRTKATARPRHRFDIPRRRELVSDRVRAVIRDCCEGRSPWPLVLLGPVGTGKTCAALALADHVQCSTRFLTMAELCGALIDAQQGQLWESLRVTERKLTPERFWHQWSEEGLAVLDEIAGRRNVSDHHREVLQRALDTRQGKPMVITANLTVDEIGELYDDRIASRLTGGTSIWIDGEDRRMETDDRIPPPRSAEDIKAAAQRRQRLAEERTCREARLKRKRFALLFATLSPDDRAAIVEAADAAGHFSQSRMYDRLNWRAEPFGGKCRSVADACVLAMERRGLAPADPEPVAVAVTHR